MQTVNGTTRAAATATAPSTRTSRDASTRSRSRSRASTSTDRDAETTHIETTHTDTPTSYPIMIDTNHSDWETIMTVATPFLDFAQEDHHHRGKAGTESGSSGSSKTATGSEAGAMGPGERTRAVLLRRRANEDRSDCLLRHSFVVKAVVC